MKKLVLVVLAMIICAPLAIGEGGDESPVTQEEEFYFAYDADAKYNDIDEVMRDGIWELKDMPKRKTGRGTYTLEFDGGQVEITGATG